MFIQADWCFTKQPKCSNEIATILQQSQCAAVVPRAATGGHQARLLGGLRGGGASAQINTRTQGCLEDCGAGPQGCLEDCRAGPQGCLEDCGAGPQGCLCRNGFDMIQSQPLRSSFKLIISFTFSRRVRTRNE